MDKKKIKKQLDDYVRKIVNNISPERIALFGSFTRDDFDPEESDVDLVIISEKFKNIDMMERWREFYPLDNYETTFQIFPLTQEELENETFPTVSFSQPTWVDLYRKTK